MSTSEALNEIAAALALAQGEMGNPIKRHTANVRSDKGSYSYKYADLADTRDAVIPILAKNKIAVVQITKADGLGRLVVHTRLIHASGQWIESEFPITGDITKPQVVGSAMTYARRYSLAAICGIAAEEDDDANAAQEHGKTQPPAWEKVKQEALKEHAASAGAVVRTTTKVLQESQGKTSFSYHALFSELQGALPSERQKWKLSRVKELNKLPADELELIRLEYERLEREKPADTSRDLLQGDKLPDEYAA